MKILVYCESPVAETGAAQIAKYLLPLLASLGEVEVVASNHLSSMPYDKEQYPYVLYPVDADIGVPHEGETPYEHASSNYAVFLNIERARKHIAEGGYDLLFLTGDLQVLTCFSDVISECRKERDFKVIVYAPLDTDIVFPPLLQCLQLADYPVVYSDYAKRIIARYDRALAERLHVIYHGCEPAIFYPLPHEKRAKIREERFRCDPDTFLVINVNRNQFRKDLARTMLAFHLFHEEYPQSKLYLHAKMHDLGGYLPIQALVLGLTLGKEILFPSETFDERRLPREKLNELYNAADVMVSTSTGEGFGLTTTEAMAAGVPFIGPRNTTFPEILGEHEERGYLAKSGGSDLWSIPYGISDMPLPREIVSVTDMGAKLAYVYTHRDEAKEKADVARMWTEQHTWEHVQEAWTHLLSNVAGVSCDYSIQSKAAEDMKYVGGAC